MYGDVWNSKGLRTAGRILQGEIIQIQNNAEIEDEWAQREKLYGNVWNSKQQVEF